MLLTSKYLFVLSNVRITKKSVFSRKYFPSDKYPSLNEMYKNVSLILLANHFTEGIIRPEVPSLIQIGGIQAKPKPDPLPEVRTLLHIWGIICSFLILGLIFNPGWSNGAWSYLLQFGDKCQKF